MSEGATILVADDDPQVLELFRELLDKGGYRLFTALHGKEAVEIARNHPIGVAILDLRMPGMDGVEALKEIKGINERTQVLIVTAYADTESLRECSVQGAFDYIPKPVHLREITEALQHALLRGQIENDLLKNRFKERLVELEKELGKKTRQLR